MIDTGVIAIQDRTTRDNPWPGLRSYDEEEQDFFCGRQREAQELLRLVKRDVLAVFFGISGIGKSSLLKAGLFPELRRQAFLPVRVRLNFAESNADFGRDVIREFERQAGRHKVSLDQAAASSDGPETMWEYFHRVRVWDHADPITPVLVFDQFEEIFTLGSGPGASRGVSAFLTELADLVENQIPATVRKRIERDRRPPAYPTDGTPYRVILALREDYLANLEGLVPQMPSLSKRNRFRLLPMSKGQALDAVLQPGAGVIQEPVARQIVSTIGFTRRASGTATSGASDESDDDEIEPFLLSLVCRELNNRRQDQKLPVISSDLVQSAQGGVGSILSNFYDRCLQDQPPPVRAFVEDQLVGKTGFRQMVAIEDLREMPVVLGALPMLVTRRLLRIEEDRHGVERVELTHDVLTPMAVERRNRRLLQEATERTWQEHRAERRRRLVPLLTILLTLAVGGLGVAVWQWRVAAVARQQAIDERNAAQRQLRALGIAQEAATAALQVADELRAANVAAYDRLKKATPATAPAPTYPTQTLQLQYRAETELAASSRASKGGDDPVAQTAQAPTARVYFQVRSDREAERARRSLLPLLRNAGFATPEPEVIKTGPPNTEVRYFRATERQVAERIAGILRSAGVENVQPRYVPGFEDSKRIRANHFETWLTPSDRAEVSGR